jgi:hypothetical protein
MNNNKTTGYSDSLNRFTTIAKYNINLNLNISYFIINNL